MTVLRPRLDPCNKSYDRFRTMPACDRERLLIESNRSVPVFLGVQFCELPFLLHKTHYAQEVHQH